MFDAVTISMNSMVLGVSDPVVISIISVVVGGIFTAVFKIIDAKANEAKDEVNKNSAAVEAANKTIEGMVTLADQLRIEYDRVQKRADSEKERADREHDRADKLQKDLIEEKAITLALSKQKKDAKE